MHLTHRYLFMGPWWPCRSFLINQHHQHSFYEIQNWKFWNVMKYPHTVICLIIHLAACVFLFWQFTISDPSNYNRFEELLVELHLLAQYFAKMFCFYCHLSCDVVKENYCHTTSEIFDCIAGGGGLKVFKKIEKMVE